MDKGWLSMLIGGTNSGTALAMAKIAEKKPSWHPGPGSARRPAEACSPLPCITPPTPWPGQGVRLSHLIKVRRQEPVS
jgi:hypothetical protein